jgi:hypothetical protein
MLGAAEAVRSHRSMAQEAGRHAIYYDEPTDPELLFRTNSEIALAHPFRGLLLRDGEHFSTLSDRVPLPLERHRHVSGD